MTPATIQCQFFPPPSSLKDTRTFLLEKEELFQVQNKKNAQETKLTLHREKIGHLLPVLIPEVADMMK